MINEEMDLGTLSNRLQQKDIYQVQMKQRRIGWHALYTIRTATGAHRRCKTQMCTTFGQMVDELLEGERIEW